MNSVHRISKYVIGHRHICIISLSTASVHQQMPNSEEPFHFFTVIFKPIKLHLLKRFINLI